MSFPDDTDLSVTCEAAFGADLTASPTGWTFTDLSDRVVTSSPISISRSAIVGGRVSKGSAGSITLLNDDGQLSIDHPGSDWWPFVDQGTPIRVAVTPPTTTYATDTFSRTVVSGWGTPEFGPVGKNWQNPFGGLSVASNQGRFTHAGAANEIFCAAITLPHKNIEMLYDTTCSVLATGNPIGVGPIMRASLGLADYMWPVMELRPGGTIRWVLWQRVATAFSNPAQAVQSGLTYTAGTVIRCRVRYTDGRVQARAWLAAGAEPSTWALDVYTSALLDGGQFAGFQSWRQTGNTNATPIVTTIDNLTMQSAPTAARIEGYVADIKPKFIPLGDGQTHSVVQIDIGGASVRLGKRTADAMSPIRRSIQNDAVPPIAYWPLEDKREAASAASAYPEQAPMAVTGPAVFAFDTSNVEGPRYEDFASSLGYTSLAAGARLVGTVPVVSTTEWTVGAQIDAWVRGIGGGVTEARLFEWSTGGTFNRWALVGTMTGHQVRAYNDLAGTSTTVIASTNNLGFLASITVTGKQNGGNIDCQLVINAVIIDTGSVAGTAGAPAGLVLNPDKVNTTASTDPFGIRFYVGHAVVYDIATDNAQPRYVDGRGAVVLSQRAWNNEVLHERAARLCAEERIPFRAIGSPYDGALTLLGPQQPGTFSDLLTSTVESGSGDLLMEAEFGYVLLPRSQRYNQEPMLTVDMSTYKRASGTDPGDVLVPVLGRPGANYWTIERRNGSSATYAASEEYRRRKGSVTDKATLDLLSDADCAPHAQWRTHLSVDGTGGNYPSFEVDLSANPELIDAWLRCGVGSRVQWTNQPTIAGLGTIDQIVEGITETFSHSQSSGGRSWTAKLDTSPASVWDVGVWDSSTSLWAPSNTTLSSSVNTTAVSWSMNSHGEPWITGAVSLRAQLGREEVLITNISGSGSAWTFTVTRSVNGVVVAHTANTEQIVLLDAGVWAL